MTTPPPALVLDLELLLKCAERLKRLSHCARAEHRERFRLLIIKLSRLARELKELGGRDVAEP